MVVSYREAHETLKDGFATWWWVNLMPLRIKYIWWEMHILPNQSLAGFQRQFLTPRYGLKISNPISNSCDFLASTNMYEIEINALMFRCYMLDVPKHGCVLVICWIYKKVVILRYMFVISYTNESDQCELHINPNRTLRQGWEKPRKPCQRLRSRAWIRMVGPTGCHNWRWLLYHASLPLSYLLWHI